MPNFFYFDEDNRKQGPLTPAQVKTLAAKGIITPDTPMMTDTGKSGLAKQLPGLFATPAAQPPTPKTLTKLQSLSAAIVRRTKTQSDDCGTANVPKSSRFRIPHAVSIPLILLVFGIPTAWAYYVSREVNLTRNTYHATVSRPVQRPPTQPVQLTPEQLPPGWTWEQYQTLTKLRGTRISSWISGQREQAQLILEGNLKDIDPILVS